MVGSWKNGEISVKDFDYKFGNVGSFSFLFFWFLNQVWEYPIEGLDELPWIKDNLF